jgi:hypothetical protein
VQPALMADRCGWRSLDSTPRGFLLGAVKTPRPARSRQVNLADFVRRARTGIVVIERGGKDEAFVISRGQLESKVGTLDLLADPDFMAVFTDQEEGKRNGTLKIYPLKRLPPSHHGNRR